MYNSSPQAGLAALTASPYADLDVMNVRMTPREVAGLQQLAMSYGANRQDLYDPITGQPRFSFLKKILPMIAGAVLPSFKPFAQFAETVGFGSQALGTALIVGGTTGLIEGDLKKGLMAGLGAYSGAKIGEGLSASASKVGGAEPAPATESTVQTAPVTAKLPGIPSTKDEILGSPTLRTFDVDATRAANWSPTQAADVVKTVTPPPSTGFFGTMGQGVSGLMKPEGRTAFMEALGGPISKSAVFMGAVDALTPTQKPLPMGGAAGEDIVYIPGGFNPQYGTGRDQPYQLPGKYYKRTPQGLVPYNPFQLAPPGRGFAAGGPVQASDQNMNQQRMIPHQTPQYPFPNQNYPLSTVMQANYQSNSPQPREVVGGYEVAIDPYNGEERFAEGGMVPGGPETFTPINTSPYAATTTDPNVLATRAYIEELNRRARNPFIGPYPGTATGGGGLTSYGTPGTYQPSTGGGGDGGGTTAGGGLGALAASVAGSYLLNKGIGAGVDYLRDKFFPGKSEEQQPASTDQKPATSTSPVTAANAALAVTSPFIYRPPPEFAGTPGYEITPLEDPNLPGQSTGEIQGSRISPVTAANAALAATSPFIGPPEFAGTPGYEITPLEDPTLPGQSTGETQVSGRAAPSKAISPITYTSAALNALNPFAKPSPIYSVGVEEEIAAPEIKEPGQLDANLQAKTRVPNTSAPLSSYLSAGASGLAGLSGLGSAAKTGLTKILPVGSEEVLASYLSPGSSAAANAAAAAGTSGTGAAGTEAAKAGLGKSAILPGLQTALGAYETFKGIQSGKESQAALGGFGLGAGLAGLGSAGVSSLGGLAALGATPVGLAAAAIAAIGASLVNTKEFGDVALRNYWNAVDKGRGIGETDPNELAQGFINFYRTNKNEFPGQAKYGRTGNEDFVYDMTQVINDAVKSGKVGKDVDPGTMYKQVVQPWLNTMGEGPKNEDAKRIQDFMMTDLINSFMQGKPISNAQVKGDSKYKIVSEKPVYAGAAPPTLPTALPRTESIDQFVRQAESFAPPNPFAAREDRISPRREMREMERESIMPTGEDVGIPQAFDLTPEQRDQLRIRGENASRMIDMDNNGIDDRTEAASRESIMPTGEGELIPSPQRVERPGTFEPGGDYRGPAPPILPEPIREGIMPTGDGEIIAPMAPDDGIVYETLRPSDYMDNRESVMPVEETVPLYEPYNPYAEKRAMYRPDSGRYMFAAGGAIGDDYNFGFRRGGMPEYLAGGKLLKGPGDGMSDSIPAVIRGKGVQRAALADGEFVIPADVVSHLGNGSTNAGAKKLYAMMNKIRQARTGRTRQAPAVKTDRYLPA